MNAIMFLSIRAAHVLVAGLWIGSTVFGAAWLMPAIDASGPSGGQVMRRIVQNGYSTYMSAIGLTTLLTGLYLLWRFTGGFDPSVAATHAGMVFGTGGGPVSWPARSVELSSAAAHRSCRPWEPCSSGRSKTCSRQRGPARGYAEAPHGDRHTAVIALQCVALMSMAVGHYV